LIDQPLKNLSQSLCLSVIALIFSGSAFAQSASESDWAIKRLNTNDKATKPSYSLGSKKSDIGLKPSLSASDIGAYRSAFASIESGNFSASDTFISQISDKGLMGYVEFNRLFHKNYNASYDELISWLERYPDNPNAMRAWNLAKRKKPDGSEDPAFPKLSQTSQNSSAQRLSATSQKGGGSEITPATAGPDSPLTPKSARSAYNDGKLELALKLGAEIGDPWVAGLAAFRLKRFEESQKYFDFIANDPSKNAWSQSGGAYWAGRVADLRGQKAEAELYFRLAASFPFTFYGLLAETRLGVDFAWTQSHPTARRVSQLVEVGQRSDARTELRNAIQRAPDQATRNNWLALAAKYDLSISQIKTTDRLFDASIYPLPDLEPNGGYQIDKALVFALARKESKFNPNAKSFSGAYGLLQIMPATAVVVTKNQSLLSNPDQLLDPGINLKIGQDYILKLLEQPSIEGDLLRALAAYNAGEKWVRDAMRTLGPEADSLLVMESIPVAQTRQYVEEVAANYWIYRHIMGKSSKTLAMAASDAKIITALSDR
jgi:soluble lytic murein transglycosylase